MTMIMMMTVKLW